MTTETIPEKARRLLREAPPEVIVERLLQTLNATERKLASAIEDLNYCAGGYPRPVHIARLMRFPIEAAGIARKKITNREAARRVLRRMYVVSDGPLSEELELLAKKAASAYPDIPPRHTGTTSDVFDFLDNEVGSNMLDSNVADIDFD
jgi:hypothetical protein